MYAVVDIETTGGYASANGITEIAIFVHDGERVIKHFESLINPHQLIPRYICSLTGITNEMVADAPSFEQVAEIVYDLLKDNVFVAHNVNFDYSFVNHQLKILGLQLSHRKLCTVRLSKKVFLAHKKQASCRRRCQSNCTPA
jgi:DNA polymerase III subunit epsilon